jgi:hypothetical protein
MSLRNAGNLLEGRNLFEPEPPLLCSVHIVLVPLRRLGEQSDVPALSEMKTVR